MCEPASHASQGVSQLRTKKRAMRAMRAKKRAMRVMAASHASEPWLRVSMRVTQLLKANRFKMGA